MTPEAAATPPVLLDCPFCGGSAYYRLHKKTFAQYVTADCSSCGARSGKCRTEAEAGERWNRRVTRSPGILTLRPGFVLADDGEVLKMCNGADPTAVICEGAIVSSYIRPAEDGGRKNSRISDPGQLAIVRAFWEQHRGTGGGAP